MSLTLDQFACLASPLRPSLERQARTTVGQDAEDIVSDVYLDAMSNLDGCPSDGSSPGDMLRWLRMFLRQRISRWTDAKRPPTVPLTESALMRAMRQTEEEDAALLVRAERLGEARLRLRIAPLTPTQRACVVADLEGEKQAETARRLGISLPAANKALRIGRMRMRAVPVDILASADLDGYVWRVGSRVTIYRRPRPTGAQLATTQLRKMTLRPVRRRRRVKAA